jgi:hypothetical protein
MSARDIPETMSYTPFAIMDDGENLCVTCVRDESNPVHDDEPDDGWRIIGWSHSGEVEEEQICAHCGRIIVAALDD